MKTHESLVKNILINCYGLRVNVVALLLSKVPLYLIWKYVQRMYIIFYLDVRILVSSHYAKIQKYEEANLGLQFFDLWC